MKRKTAYGVLCDIKQCLWLGYNQEEKLQNVLDYIERLYPILNEQCEAKESDDDK